VIFTEAYFSGKLRHAQTLLAVAPGKSKRKVGEALRRKAWFTHYARADEFLHVFPTGGVHIRELVKYSNYKALASK
jgi:hypothetical protein